IWPTGGLTRMAIETANPIKRREGPGSQNTAGLDLDELRQLWLKPLWLVLGDAFTAEPNTQIVPHIWKWSDVRPRILEAGRRISAEEAERRVLMYLNPGLEGRPGATQRPVLGQLLADPELPLPGCPGDARADGPRGRCAAGGRGGDARLHQPAHWRSNAADDRRARSVDSTGRTHPGGTRYRQPHLS